MLTHSGGLYCVANIRGGGEFGEDWHKAAIREKRPVAFNDFEECGRYLIREGWTCKKKNRLALGEEMRCISRSCNESCGRRDLRGWNCSSWVCPLFLQNRLT